MFRLSLNKLNKILIADTIELFREGVRSVIHELNNDIECIQISSYDELICLNLDIFNIILLEHIDEFKILKLIKSQVFSANTKVIVVSPNNNKRDLKEFLSLGIHGYLLKKSTKQELAQTILSVLAGEKYFCPFVMETLLTSPQEEPEIAELTTREVEITRLIAVGLKNKEIADRLSVSPHTIHSHRKNILRKTGVSSALELSIYAKENNI